LVLDFVANQLADEPAFEDGDGSYPREQLSGSIVQSGEVSDDEDFRMVGDAEIGRDQNAAGAIDGYAEFVPQW
jgi:hypothetical protein